MNSDYKREREIELDFWRFRGDRTKPLSQFDNIIHSIRCVCRAIGEWSLTSLMLRQLFESQLHNVIDGFLRITELESRCLRSNDLERSMELLLADTRTMAIRVVVDSPALPPVSTPSPPTPARTQHLSITRKEAPDSSTQVCLRCSQ